MKLFNSVVAVALLACVSACKPEVDRIEVEDRPAWWQPTFPLQ